MRPSPVAYEHSHAAYSRGGGPGVGSLCRSSFTVFPFHVRGAQHRRTTSPIGVCDDLHRVNLCVSQVNAPSLQRDESRSNAGFMMYSTLAAFADALAGLPAPDTAYRDAAMARQQTLTKPPGSLGRLERLAVDLAGWSADGRPRAERAVIAIFAGNHGIAARGVSPYPAAVTAQMVANFEAGGAAINAIARSVGADLCVRALDLEQPTQDITQTAALDADEVLAALNAGASALEPERPDLIAVGEMGIGNTTVAAALAASVLGGTGADWAGPGTGHDPAGVRLKASVVDAALGRHAAASTAVERLRCLGGREITAIAGAIVAARHMRVPVIVDGAITAAALAVLWHDNPRIIDHCIAGHRSAEPAHARLLEAMGMVPLLDLGLRLGEGSGAALAIAVVRAAAAAHNEMATFEEASVSNLSPR